MNEFSESYHLWSSSVRDGVELLQRANMRGYVLAPNNGWVTLCPVDDTFGLHSPLVKANQGLLFHYMYAEGYGWNFDIVNGSKVECTYQCEGGDEVRVNDRLFSKFYFLRFVDYVTGGKKGPDAEALLPRLYPRDLEEAEESGVAKELAEMLGLPNYDWLSGESITEGLGLDPARRAWKLAATID